MSDTLQILNADYDRRAWHADALMGWRLADARAHAERGDLPAAGARHQELGDTLVGKLRDARTHAYRRSFARHRREGLDPAVHQVELELDAEGEHAVRNAMNFGRSLHLDLSDQVEDTKAALVSVALAASDARTPRIRGGALVELAG